MHCGATGVHGSKRGGTRALAEAQLSQFKIRFLIFTQIFSLRRFAPDWRIERFVGTIRYVYSRTVLPRSIEEGVFSRARLLTYPSTPALPRVQSAYFFPQGGQPENPRVQSAPGATESEGSISYDPVFL